MGELRTIALCAGIGGLELGVARVLPTRVVCWVERDAYAQRVLQARFADGRLDEAPIWDDLTSFDGTPWRGTCELLAAGFPCQPYSTAGKKLGPADERDLWDHVARVAAEVRPPLVVLENVARLVRAPGGLERVLRDLAALGFDAEWGVVKASHAGAPHGRARLFLLALSDAGRERLREQSRRGGRTRGEGSAELGDAHEELADSDCTGRRRRQSACHSGEDRSDAPGDESDGRGCAGVGDTRGPRSQGSSSSSQTEVRGWRWPPGPSDFDAWRAVLAVRPDLEPSVRSVAHGDTSGLVRDSKGRIANRRAQLKCLGNAVVPAQAALALEALIRRALER